jgi:RNA polymerase sigma factor (sigma-70 family)
MVTLTTGIVDVASGAAEILRVHTALEEMAARDKRMAGIVEMQYFAGTTQSEIAEAIGVDERTVRREWEKARLFLREVLGGASLDDRGS